MKLLQESIRQCSLTSPCGFWDGRSQGRTPAMLCRVNYHFVKAFYTHKFIGERLLSEIAVLAWEQSAQKIVVLVVKHFQLVAARFGQSIQWNQYAYLERVVEMSGVEFFQLNKTRVHLDELVQAQFRALAIRHIIFGKLYQSVSDFLNFLFDFFDFGGQLASLGKDRVANYLLKIFGFLKQQIC